MEVTTGSFRRRSEVAEGYRHGMAGNGFYYSRYPAPEGGDELSSKNDDHTVYYHRVGTPQSPDELVFEDKAHPQRFHTVGTTDDEHFAILTFPIVARERTVTQSSIATSENRRSPGTRSSPKSPTTPTT